MEKNQIETMLIQISANIAEINSNLKNSLQRLENHETRILSLEQNKGEDFKTEMLKYLAKALIATIAIIASLTGAGSLIKGIFN